MDRVSTSSLSALRTGRAGFTLIEIMVSIAILLMLMGVMAAMVAVVSPVVKQTGNATNSFQQARAGYEALTQTLAQASLMTYWDYVGTVGGVAGQSRTASNASTFIPTGFARTSQLHFVSGSASASRLIASGTNGSLVPGGSSTITPGDAVFFQAPLGRSNNNATYEPLNSSLNEIGFYVQYSDDTSDWPNFVSSGLGTDYRFRLMEWVPQTQNIAIYNSTLQANYSLAWINTYLPSVGVPPSSSTTPPQDAPRVLAENVVLLVILPKLAPEDEANLAGESSSSYTAGSLLCPNYEYDSRSWQTGYNPGSSGSIGAVQNTNFGASSYALVNLMRNQLPPLVDVVMVAIGDTDALRLQKIHGTTLPPELALPAPSGSFTAFQSSASLNGDMQYYENQLTQNHIAYKVFWSTVQIKGAKWSLN
jgi:uncharacterized protein (TIGR02599 family)